VALPVHSGACFPLTARRRRRTAAPV
jgi:hypothetical protein